MTTIVSIDKCENLKLNEDWANFFINIEATQIVTEPFPHIAARNVLPSKMFDSIIAHLPPLESYYFNGRKQGDQNGNEVQRAYFELRDEKSINRLPIGLRAFWVEMMNPILIMNLTKRLFKRFDINLNRKEQQILNPIWTLSRDFGGYELPVHTDALNKFLSAIFYLPTPERESVHGTSLFRLKASAPRPLSYNQRYGATPSRFRREDFETAIRLPFKSNTMLAFLRAENSFHGVDFIGAGDIQRDTLTLNVFYKG